MSVGGAKNEISLQLGGDDLIEMASFSMSFYNLSRPTNLTDNVLVGDSDDQSVLGGVVLVLGLRHESLSCVVVGLTL